MHLEINKGFVVFFWIFVSFISYLCEIFEISMRFTEHISYELDMLNCNLFSIHPFMVKLMLIYAYWQNEHVCIVNLL